MTFVTCSSIVGTVAAADGGSCSIDVAEFESLDETFGETDSERLVLLADSSDGPFGTQPLDCLTAYRLSFGVHAGRLYLVALLLGLFRVHQSHRRFP